MIALFRQRNFSLLWFGGLISFIGDWVLFVALPLYIFKLTESVLATGAIFIINSIPGLLLGSVAGVYVDRWDRRKVLMVTNLLRGPLLLGLLFVDSPDRVWIVYVIGFMGRCVGEFMYPAEHALLPKLVGKEDLVTANALNSLNNNLARLIGPAVGGVVVQLWGFSSAVLIDVASFLIAGVMVWLIAAPESVTRAQHEEGEVPEETAEPGKPNVMGEWREGLALIRRNRTVSALFALLGLNGIAEGFIAVMIVIFVKQTLGGGELEMGWILTAQAVGGLIGGIFVGRLSKAVAPRLLVAWGFIILGVIDGVIFNSASVLAAVILMAVVGVPVVALQAGAMTLVQTSVPDRFRGRVFGAFGTTQSLIMILSLGFASLFGSDLGVLPMLTMAAVFDVLAGVAAFLLIPKMAGAKSEEPVQSVPAEAPTIATVSLAGNTSSD
jgi:MFS family permease